MMVSIDNAYQPEQHSSLWKARIHIATVDIKDKEFAVLTAAHQNAR